MHCVWAPSPRSRRGPTGTCSSSRSSTTGQACPMRPSATCRPATTPAVLVGCGSPGVFPTTRRATPPTQAPASGSSSTAERPHAVAFLCDAEAAFSISARRSGGCAWGSLGQPHVQGSASQSGGVQANPIPILSIGVHPDDPRRAAEDQDLEVRRYVARNLDELLHEQPWTAPAVSPLL